MTSHAAVVARGMGRPCVCGAGELQIKEAEGVFRIFGREVRKGEVITVDGAAGQVLFGEVEMTKPDLSGDFGKLMEWADRARTLKVRTNAETPADVLTAKSFGAEGIGLCRTEHMFFDSDRINVVREMILADNEAGRQTALEKLLPFQQSDFEELFKVMKGLPVTIRLLDPPLHEFLPHGKDEIADVAKALGRDLKEVTDRVSALHELNPMLGHRGCRLAVSYPEIAAMQARAIFAAALAVGKETGEMVQPEIMVPLVSTKKELEIVKAVVDKVATDVFEQQGEKLTYSVGTMIELPRAALTADQIAHSAEFFSFGTNDLTQTTFGISRDDAGAFMPDYLRQGIMEQDPFVSLDSEGVGQLVAIGADRGRKTRSLIKLGICGEHGGDPASISFCESIGLDYVSCSPYRVPIARLAAAQASLASKA